MNKYLNVSRSQALAYLKKQLSFQRFNHSLRVEEAAIKLCECWGGDQSQVSIASLFHDSAKELDIKVMKDMAEKYDPNLKKYPDIGGAILHGPAAAYLLKTEFDCQDPVILKAVEKHTTGDVEMDLVSKIVFVADYIESGRDFPGVEEARRLAYSDLDQAVVYKMAESIKHLAEKRQMIFKPSIDVYNAWILK